MDIGALLERLERVKSRGEQHEACCPAHDDRRRSLGVRAGDDGRILVYCQAGCSALDICEALGLRLGDLMPPREQCSMSLKIVATYDYRDEQGRLLYQVTRLDPKDFRRRAPDGRGGWCWSTRGIRRVLYRLPDLLGAPSVCVVMCEGEKDVDRLVREGFRCATTIDGGAGKPVDNSILEPLRGRMVAIIPDRDAPGIELGARLERQLRALGCEAVTIAIPEGKDVSEWLDRGGTRADLERMIRRAFHRRLIERRLLEMADALEDRDPRELDRVFAAMREAMLPW